ncbi:heme A synthase [Deinococcus psychrotolerans]|uniref:Heme A synthase n=1 Tax=Deinococcus psychrotolerans TaxID=2489213 RepID=A0A3G8Y844_9DEIO|nr:COX15/CtaA family protein [Deinococcus psychrotolerans]AZI41549.1 heme A synthase [Deinococcus psychrotolerans]
MEQGKAGAGKAQAVKVLVGLSWAALAYNVLVILWGAYVRISGSGAGCGAHWPLCDGQVIPRSFTLERVVEFSHRGSSSLSGLLAIAVVALAFFATKRGHPARLGAVWSLGLILFEGVIGGVQVLLGLTAGSTDPARGFVQGLHLANTFLLLGALLLTALWAGGAPRFTLRSQGWLSWGSPLATVLMLLLGMAGAVTALGDKLFVPAPGTPIDTVKRDFGATASIIENLRVIHPALALVVCAYLVWFAGRVLRERLNPMTQRWSYALYGVIGAQMLIGVLNVALKAPGTMQIIHLLFACLMWLITVMVVYSALVTQPMRRVTLKAASA